MPPQGRKGLYTTWSVVECVVNWVSLWHMYYICTWYICNIMYVDFFAGSCPDCYSELHALSLHPSQTTDLHLMTVPSLSLFPYPTRFYVIVLQNSRTQRGFDGNLFPSISSIYPSSNPLNAHYKHIDKHHSLNQSTLIFFHFFLLLSIVVIIGCWLIHLLVFLRRFMILSSLHPYCLFPDTTLSLLCLCYLSA